MTNINSGFYVVWTSNRPIEIIPDFEVTKEDWMGPFKSEEEAVKYIGFFSGVFEHGTGALGSHRYKIVEFS